MFAVERIKRIKEILFEQKKIDVLTLSNELSVSEVTIRRDLEKLESENFLTRSHGGAILNEHLYSFDSQLILPLDITNANEKNMIGKICSYMINDNDTVLLGPGSTCRFIAKHIKNKKNIKIVTTDILIAAELTLNSPDVKVVLTGGDVDAFNFQLGGRLAESTLRNFFVNIAFIEVDGVSFDRGYTVDSIDKASIIKEMISVSKDVIAVCDYTRFGNISFSPLGPISMFKKVVSNEQSPDEYKKFYFNNNIQFITTFDVYQDH